MIAPNTTNNALKCERCQTVVPGFEDSFNCIYCQFGYCPSCLGYTKYFDMDELEVIINKWLNFWKTCAKWLQVKR